jgi:hypothetical protein
VDLDTGRLVGGDQLAVLGAGELGIEDRAAI